VLDERGVLVEKRFEQSYPVRPSGAALADDLAPAPVDLPSLLHVTAES